MKKILSIILITACLACGCSSASDTEKNASKSTASEPESIDFFAMDTTIKFSAYGDKKVLKGANHHPKEVSKGANKSSKNVLKGAIHDKIQS